MPQSILFLVRFAFSDKRKFCGLMSPNSIYGATILIHAERKERKQKIEKERKK